MLFHNKGIIKIIFLLLFFCLFLALYVIFPSFFQELWQLLKRGEIVEMASYMASFGKWSFLFAFLLTVVFNAIGFPPAMIFSAACTLMFGLVPGILLAWVAETVGAVISFLFFRTFLRDQAEALIQKEPRLAKWDGQSQNHGFKIMLVARLIPYFPAAALNALGALSKMSFRDYTLSSFLGKFPATAVEAMIGHDAVMAESHGERLFGVILFSLLAYAGFYWWDKKKR